MIFEVGRNKISITIVRKISCWHGSIYFQHADMFISNYVPVPQTLEF